MNQFKLWMITLILTSNLSQAKIEIEDFFKFPDLTSIKISPDGKHLAATVESDGIKKLAILNSDATKIKHIFNFSSEKREIGSYGWLNNERIYAAMVQKVGPLAQPRATGYLFAGNINGKKTVQLLPSKGKSVGKRRTDIPRGYRILSYLPEDDKNILISQIDNTFAVAYKMNVYTGNKKVVDKSPEKYASLLADKAGHVKLSTSFNDDGSEYKIHIKPNQKSEWELFKVFDDKNIQIRPLDFNSTNDKLFYLDYSDESKQGIYSLDLVTKSSEFIHPMQGDSDIFNLIYDFNYEAPELIGFSRMPGYMEIEFFDPKHQVAAIYRTLLSSFPGQSANIINSSKDGKQAIVSVWSDTNPGNHYLLDLNNNQVRPLFTTMPWIDRKYLAPMQPIEFAARDGLEIRGYLTLPLQKNDSPAPMVVMVHGGPYGVADQWEYNREVQFLAHHGYSVLQVNYRGSGGRGAEFQYDNYRKMGKEMQYDLTDATLWAIEKGHAASDKICIYGGSYGGYAALMGVTQEPDLYQCAIGYVGLYDIDLVKHSDTVTSKGGRRFVDEAWNRNDEAFVKERSPIYHVNKITADVFLIHGGKDPRVSVKNFHQLSKALDDANIPHKKLLKPYEGHGFFDLENNVELYTQMLSFLNQHIGQTN